MLAGITVLSLDSIGARLAHLRGAMNQREFAKRIGVSQSTVARWEINKVSPDARELRRICEAFAVETTWLLDGKGSPPKRTGKSDTITPDAESQPFVVVPRLRARAIADDEPDFELGQSTEGLVMLSTDDVESIGVPSSHLAIVRLESDAMAPTINAGDEVIIDRTEKTLRSGIWMFALGNELIAHGVQMQPDGSAVLLSDNKRYRPTPLAADQLAGIVIGRVLRVRMKKL